MIVHATRAAGGPSGQLSANISNLFGTQTVAYNPGAGGWSEKLPSVGGLGPSSGAKSPLDPRDNMRVNPAWADCVTRCEEWGPGQPVPWYGHQKTQAEVDACKAGCPPQFLPANQIPSASAGGDPLGFCGDCAPLNPGACIGCAWQYASHAGIEIGIIALIGLGLYLWLK